MKTKFLFLFLILATIGLKSCKTHTMLSQKVSLGMTKEQVISICGKPYKTSSKYDKEENLQEILFYKEKTWDDGGWSWSTTVANHMFIFRNGKLVAIEQGDEEHNKQQYNTLFVW
jgi:hypothetical protein